MGINQYKKFLKKGSWIVILLCTFCGLGFAQDGGDLRVQFSQDSVRLGEPIDLTLQILVPSNTKIISVQIPLDSLKALSQRIDPSDSTKIPYEVLDYGTWAPVNNNTFLPAHLNWQPQAVSDGRQLFQNTLKIVIWEPGYFGLLPCLADVEMPRGAYDLVSNQLIIGITLPNQNQISGIDSTGLAPLKPILRESPESMLKKILGGLLGALLLGGLLYYFVFKKKSRTTEVIEIPPTPEEVAMAAFADIEQRSDWEAGLLKKYYDELTHVLRKYLEDRLGVKALESTTDEILRDLRAMEFEATWVDGLKKLLPMTDMVKFAKAEPHDEAHREWLTWSRSLVEANKNTFVKTAQSEGETLVQLKEKKWKSIAIFDDQLWISKIKTSSKKVFKGGIGIPLRNISQFSYQEGSDELLVYYATKNDKSEKQSLLFVSNESLQSFVETLNGLLTFTKKEEEGNAVYLSIEK